MIRLISFLLNIIFTFYYLRVRPKCDFSILGRNDSWLDMRQFVSSDFTCNDSFLFSVHLGLLAGYSQYWWVISHKWMSHVTRVDESCHTHRWVTSHVWMRDMDELSQKKSSCVWSRKVGDVGGVCKGWKSETTRNSHNGGWSRWKKKEPTSFKWGEVDSREKRLSGGSQPPVCLCVQRGGGDGLWSGW